MVSTRSSPISPEEICQNRAGLHIISNFETDKIELLYTGEQFRRFIDAAIIRNELNKVGEAYHDFEGGGFTAVVCLAESHLSIHTWPSRRYVTFDIFLSNFTMDNSPKAEAIYKDVLSFFDAKVIFEKTLDR